MLDFISVLPDARWPAIPAARASQLLALQFQLERSQWLSPDQLAIAQLGQLARVVAHAAKTVPLYRDRLDKLPIATDHPIDLSDWQQVPLLTRSDWQTSGERAGSEQKVCDDPLPQYPGRGAVTDRSSRHLGHSHGRDRQNGARCGDRHSHAD